MPKPNDLILILGSLAVGAILAVLVRVSRPNDHTGNTPKAISSEGLIQKLPEAPTTTSAQRDETFERLIQKKDEAIRRCSSEKGHPAMGFGYKVICLDPNMVLWTYAPEKEP
jgi:hypothetical protein